jgi:hypothetical protein
MQVVERADPGTVGVSPDHLSAHLGNAIVEARLVGIAGGKQLEWSSASVARTVKLGPNARFEQTAAGSVRLLNGLDEPPLAIATPMRDTPYDCRFDTISRVCR